MNDDRHQYRGRALSEEEYIEALKLRDKLSKQIAEYEDESRRGCVKIIRTFCGVNRDKEGFSVRFDRWCGKGNPYWKTLVTCETVEETLEFLSAIARDLPLAYEAFRAKHEEEITNE